MNVLESELIEIPAGAFTLGDPPVPADADLRHPWHTVPEVYMPRFRLARFPVTNAQYLAFVRAMDAPQPSHASQEGFDDPDQPVVGLSWEDAEHYIRWLVRETGKAYRLPRDAEWEYAARGNHRGSRFPWGDDLSDQYACYGQQPHPPKVGQYPANGFGLHDMIGTVWEWCEQRFNDVAQRSLAFNTPTQKDPADNRVLRGGSYMTTLPLNLWIAYRHEDPADLRHHVLGVRVACDA